jgi:hypothetical protein
MPIQITATVLGHPWDLWGLSQLFDGSDASHTLIDASKPEGRPRIDTTDQAQVTRFRVHGYDLFAPITSDELRWDGSLDDIDLRDVAPVAETLVARINGIAILLDPHYALVRLYSLSYSEGESTGSLVRSDWTPNKDQTQLGIQEEHHAFADNVMPLAVSNPAVKVVLAAITLPRTWASMYLIYEAIADDVGGQHALDNLNFVSKSDLIAFRHAANNSRSIDEGMRHSKKPQPGTPLPFDVAYSIINTLAIRWMQSLMTH